jgi:predicted AlkP superfamily phosphohydrolase/phosphomutase
MGGAAAAAGLAAPMAACSNANAATKKRVVVLGMDGLDPNMVKALIERGRGPNFKKLAEMGSFKKLRTTMPALSPVAWSSFITGMTPGGHGIADFIARDPHYSFRDSHGTEVFRGPNPVFSIYETRDVDLSFTLGDMQFPLAGGGAYNLRHGKPFWAYLTELGIPATVVKIPTNFPTTNSATREISGMGTPDLADAYGMFGYYTTDYFEEYPDVTGGRVFYIDNEKGVINASLIGPTNSFHVPKDTSKDQYINEVKAPFRMYVDAENDVARIEIQGRQILLKKGEYSEWVPVDFEMLPLVSSVRGMVRFLLRDVHPHVRLYVTPVNIDPSAQSMPVTWPVEYGGELAREVGPFWTKGLPTDTSALNHRIISDEEYVKQAQIVLQETLAIFDYEWSRFDSGFFFLYVSNTDQDAHMLWRNMDPTHPKHSEGDPRFADYLFYLYEEMDKLLGKVLPAADDDTLVLIVSDHGFTQYARQFHLNSWLRREGYLALKPGSESKPKTSILDIDWTKTVAYGIGFNGLYLNLKGREEHGIIEPGKEKPIVDRLTRGLETVSDSETGIRPISKVYTRESMYTGEFTPDMPELLVGYTPGYRNSGDSVLGSTGRTIIELNPWAWSGDHSMARDLVPGTLMSSRKVLKANPSIMDLPVTILDFFGISKPQQMVGTSIFSA